MCLSMCVWVCVRHRFSGVMFVKKTRASFQTPDHLQSRVGTDPRLAASLMLCESGPIQTCFRTPHCVSPPVSAAPGQLSHFKPNYHTDSLIRSPRLSSCRFDIISNLAFLVLNPQGDDCFSGYKRASSAVAPPAPGGARSGLSSHRRIHRIDFRVPCTNSDTVDPEAPSG